MKRFVLLLLASVILITSCTETVRAEDVLGKFCREYPVSAVIYSSLSDKNEPGYIDSEMLTALYGTDEYPVTEFALVFYGKVNTVREVGVFVTENGDDVIEITELLTRRISFLSTFSDGEGFIRKYKGVLVYGFVEDSAYVQEIFDGIL
jgi:hypothetical protein